MLLYRLKVLFFSEYYVWNIQCYHKNLCIHRNDIMMHLIVKTPNKKKKTKIRLQKRNRLSLYFWSKQNIPQHFKYSGKTIILTTGLRQHEGVKRVVLYRIMFDIIIILTLTFSQFFLVRYRCRTCCIWNKSCFPFRLKVL